MSNNINTAPPNTNPKSTRSKPYGTSSLIPSPTLLVLFTVTAALKGLDDAISQLNHDEKLIHDFQAATRAEAGQTEQSTPTAAMPTTTEEPPSPPAAVDEEPKRAWTTVPK